MYFIGEGGSQNMFVYQPALDKLELNKTSVLSTD